MGEINLVLVGVIAGLLVAMSMLGRPTINLQQSDGRQGTEGGGCGLGVLLFGALVMVLLFGMWQGAPLIAVL